MIAVADATSVALKLVKIPARPAAAGRAANPRLEEVARRIAEIDLVATEIARAAGPAPAAPPPLTDQEERALREGELDPRPLGWNETHLLYHATAEYARLLNESYTVEEVARLLGVNTSRIRQRLIGPARTLFEGAPLVRPVAIAATEDGVFVADPGAGNTIWVLPPGDSLAISTRSPCAGGSRLRTRISPPPAGRQSLRSAGCGPGIPLRLSRSWPPICNHRRWPSSLNRRPPLNSRSSLPPTMYCPRARAAGGYTFGAASTRPRGTRYAATGPRPRVSTIISRDPGRRHGKSSTWPKPPSHALPRCSRARGRSTAGATIHG